MYFRRKHVSGLGIGGFGAAMAIVSKEGMVAGNDYAEEYIDRRIQFLERLMLVKS